MFLCKCVCKVVNNGINCLILPLGACPALSPCCPELSHPLSEVLPEGVRREVRRMKIRPYGEEVMLLSATFLCCASGR